MSERRLYNYGQYTPATGIAKATMVLFWIVAAVTLVEALLQLVLSGMDLSLALDVEDPAMTPTLITLGVFGLTAFGNVLLRVVLAIVFLVWINRVCKNAWSLAPRRMNSSPTWAVGCFFIPIANLFLPYRVIREMWTASASASAGDTRHGTTPPGIIGVWWILYIGGGVLAFIGGGGDELTGGVMVMGAFTSGIGMVAAVLGALVVGRLTRLQETASAGVGAEVFD